MREAITMNQDHPRRINCYICDTPMIPRVMVRIHGDENAAKQEIAITRRTAANRDPLAIVENTRLCINCNRSIVQEIREMENDPSCLRLNVLTQTSSHSCLICEADQDLYRLTTEARVNIFVHRDIYVQDGTKSCLHHLNEKGYLLEPLEVALRFVNRPYKIQGTQLNVFLSAMRNEIIYQRTKKFEDENDFTEDNFQAMSPITKAQFLDLFSFCDPVPVGGNNGTLRYVSKKDLLTFLCKMRQGLSDEILKVIFDYSSRQAVSSIITLVRQSLMQRFVPQNIGFGAIPRNDYIANHVTPFANELYNPQPEIPRAIVCNDCTYLDIERSSCFQVLRQSYCIHKGKHLIKPSMFVAPDGFILNILGPYFSNTQNNDANILTSEFERDVEGMRNWFRDQDIFIIDRGYRDAIPTLERLGINIEMPSLLAQGQRQLTTEEANSSRIVTKSRWVVEARNGQMKSIFKFFHDKIIYAHVSNIRDFLLICAGIINKYHPMIQMQDATIDLARSMLEKRNEVNIVQARVEFEGLGTRRGQWTPLEEVDLPLFPRLTLDQLRQFTIGSFQIRLAPSYIQDNAQAEREAQFQVDLLHEPGFIRVRMYSRFRNATRHQLWISYIENGEREALEDHPLQGHYCTCQSGARTIGACCHVTSVIWYLSYARYENNISYPSERLLDRVMNVANIE